MNSYPAMAYYCRDFAVVWGDGRLDVDGALSMEYNRSDTRNLYTNCHPISLALQYTGYDWIDCSVACSNGRVGTNSLCSLEQGYDVDMYGNCGLWRFIVLPIVISITQGFTSILKAKS